MSRRTIFRIHHKTRPWTAIDNAILARSDLSFKAKGLLAYLLSRPPDWRVTRKGLARLGPDGKDSVYTAMKELRAHGYLSKVWLSDGKRIQGSEWHVYEVPLSHEDRDNPTVGKSAPS